MYEQVYEWLDVNFIYLLITTMVFFCGLTILSSVKKTNKWIKNMWGLAAIVYVGILISLTLVLREVKPVRQVNFQVWQTIKETLMRILRGYVGDDTKNVLLFLPLGILCSALYKTKHRLVFCFSVGMGTSLAVECMQLITKRGYFDINDLINNVCGALIGYMIYSLCVTIGTQLFKR